MRVYTMMRRHDRSWVENFLTSWTPVLLAAMSVTSLLLRYARTPISCHYVFPQANEYFTETCFQETHLLMRTDAFNRYSTQVMDRVSRGGARENYFNTWPKQRTYHHWVPFALGVASLLCLLPHVVWRMLSGFLWLDEHALVQTLTAATGDNPSPSRAGRHVTVTDSALVVAAGLREEGRWKLSAVALTRKFLAVVTCILQLVLILAWFKPPLGGDGKAEQDGGQPSSGNVTVPDSLEDVPLPVDPFFCTVEFTQRMNVQDMTIQCRLPLNEVFRKAFTFLSYFFIILLFLCVWDAFYWLGRLFLRDRTLFRNLEIISRSAGSGPASDSDRPRRAENYLSSVQFYQSLGTDGRQVLALVADHCGPVLLLHFTAQLWNAFRGVSSGSASLSPSSAHNMAGDAELEDGGKRDVGGSPADIPLQVVHDQPMTTEDDTAKLCHG